MVVQNGVIGGLSFLSFLFAYIAFKLRDNEQAFNQALSLFFFSLSVLFANLVMNTLLLIVQNTADVSYLEDTVMLIGLQVLMWSTAVIFVLFVVVMLFLFFKYLLDEFMRVVKKNG